MTYHVEITAEAEGDIESDYAYIAQRAPLAARRWKKGIRAAIRSLNRNPQRFGLAPESSNFDYEVRQLLYGRKRNHRILYTIREAAVVILTIRHAARDAFGPDQL